MSQAQKRHALLHVAIYHANQEMIDADLDQEALEHDRLAMEHSLKEESRRFLSLFSASQSATARPPVLTRLGREESFPVCHQSPARTKESPTDAF